MISGRHPPATAIRRFSCTLLLICLPAPIAGQVLESPVASGITYRELVLQSRALVHSAPDSAETLLTQLADSWPESGEVWLLLAQARRAAGEPRASIPSFERAISLGAIDSASGAYEIAVAYAHLGEPDSAVAWIEQSLTSGYRWRPDILEDQSLAPIGQTRLQRLSGMADDSADRIEGWRGDLAFLVGEVRRVHWQYRRAPLPAEFELQRRRVSEDLGAWSDSRVVMELQRLLATLHDGHTLVYPFGMDRGEQAWLPLSMYWFDDGLYVIEAEDPGIVGAKVTGIGKLTVQETMQELDSWTSHMNPSGFRAMAPVYLTFSDLLVALGAVDSDRMVEMTLFDGTRERTVTIEARPIDVDRLRIKLFPPSGQTAPLWLARVEDPYWMQSIDQGLVYVQVNQAVDDEEEPMDEFADRILGMLMEPSTSGLVLDLRHNNGGDAVHVVPLVRMITTWRRQLPEKSFYVLIGRTTFSAAQTLVNELEIYADPTFVGEPTASPPSRFGNEASFRLPWSGVIGSISAGYNQGWSSRDARIWTEPDIPTPLTFGAYFAGRDPALEAILELERGP